MSRFIAKMLFIGPSEDTPPSHRNKDTEMVRHSDKEEREQENEEEEGWR